MLYFIIDSKELKTMSQKVATVLPKKPSMKILESICLSVKNGCLEMVGTDIDNYLVLETLKIDDWSDGTVVIHRDDMKLLEKLSGDVTIAEDETGLVVICGKKKITLTKGYVGDFPELPDENVFTKSFTCHQSWLYDSIVNLSSFCNTSAVNTMFKMVNFNIKDKRAESLDGHRIGMKSMDNTEINPTGENVMLNSECLATYKKILDKKSEAIVRVGTGIRYVEVKSNDFTFYQKLTEGKYYDVSKLIPSERKFSFTGKVANLKEIASFDADMLKGARKPITFYKSQGKLFIHAECDKREMLDEITVDKITMEDNFYIGLNPSYVLDALNVIDVDDYKVEGLNHKAPMMIYGKEYTFMILPVNIGSVDMIEKCVKRCA